MYFWTTPCAMSQTIGWELNFKWEAAHMSIHPGGLRVLPKLTLLKVDNIGIWRGSPGYLLQERLSSTRLWGSPKLCGSLEEAEINMDALACKYLCCNVQQSGGILQSDSDNSILNLLGHIECGWVHACLGHQFVVQTHPLVIQHPGWFLIRFGMVWTTPAGSINTHHHWLLACCLLAFIYPLFRCFQVGHSSFFPSDIIMGCKCG